MSFARGKRSQAISDRSGQAFPYKEMVKEWTGALVHISEYEPKHPQLDPPYHKADAVALQNTRSQDFQQPTLVNGAISSTGGQGMMTANLTLPGDFAFGTQSTQVTSNGITTSISSMFPEDPSLQNRRRELNAQLGQVTINEPAVVPVTYTVTVANPGTGNKYYIDSSVQATLSMVKGNTYTFDQAEGSNGGHPLRLSTTSNGTHSGGTEYTTGVTTNGTPGSAGAYTRILVDASAPSTLYYYCTNHSGMGGQINIS